MLGLSTSVSSSKMAVRRRCDYHYLGLRRLIHYGSP